MSDPNPMTDAHVFAHEAMNTTFSLRLRDIDFQSAQSMVTECIHELDRMEGKLSRFIDGSDVSRINRLAAGETLYISETTHQCLLAALDAYVKTSGLFDITLGTRIDHRKAGVSDPIPDVGGRLIIHPDVAAVTCEEPGRQVDLGGIGKGFALDRLKEILIDWGAGDFLLAAGASSLLAHGPSAWPVDLAGDSGSIRLLLRDESLSASGTRIQGSHIVHPAGDEAMPAQPCDRVWVTASCAALAEVWSTAFMLVSMDEVNDLIGEESGVSSVHVECGGEVTRLV